MNELIIELSEISPRDFFGHQNINIEKLKELFPKLKIVARGNKIKNCKNISILSRNAGRFDKNSSKTMQILHKATTEAHNQTNVS